MPYLMVRHKVEDWAKWKKAFDEHGAARADAGSKGGQLFRNADDPNEIVVVFSWDGMDKARAFAQSEDLKQIMERAGVADKPDVFFLDEAAKLTT